MASITQSCHADYVKKSARHAALGTWCRWQVFSPFVSLDVCPSELSLTVHWPREALGTEHAVCIKSLRLVQ